MALDPAANFVRTTTDAAINSTQTNVSVTDVSGFPTPSTDGNFNVVIWDVAAHPRPDQDPDVEILRVTAVDSGTNTLTITRAQETTSGTSHPSGSAVHLSPTAKMFGDIPDNFVSNSGDTVNGSLDVTGTLSESSNGVLTTADEGSGNGLDADTVDGQEADEIGDGFVKTSSAELFTEESTSVTQNSTAFGGGGIVLGGTFDLPTQTFSQSLNTQDATPRDLTWNDDGTKLYEIGVNGSQIYQYSVSTPYDVSTASLSNFIDTQDANPLGIAWNNNGTKLYESGAGSDLIYEYDVSTPYEISTATFSQSASLDTQQGIEWGDNGNKLYACGGKIYQYSAGTPYDISTLSLEKSVSLSFSTGVRWNNDGTKFYESDVDADEIVEYQADTPFDIGTLDRINAISSQDSSNGGIAWNDDGTKIYEIGSTGDKIYEYSGGPAQTSGESVVSFTDTYDVFSWELASTQRFDGGETATIDIEDTDGNVLFSDIGRNVNISSVSSDTNIQFRISLSRSSNLNNPRVSFVGLKYEQ